jgi:hypothetical protein
MKKTSFLSIALFTCLNYLQAQTKVFKEVSDEISSEIKIIKQDNNLVGYLAFTRLEKASEDSFNYRISIMDENLNDIGAVNFREESLTLQDIAFEQDVLCIAYIKSNVIGNSYNRKEYRGVKDNSRNYVMLQFLGLDGKIIKINSIKANINLNASYDQTSKLAASGNLKYPLEIDNIPQIGFACFYGDENGTNLTAYNPAGNQLWQKKVAQEEQFFIMHTTPNDVYLLAKHKEDRAIEGGFELFGYSVKDGSPYERFNLQDRQGNDLKILAFDNDPATGKLFLSGNIIDQYKGNQTSTGSQLSHGPYTGVFTININGPKKTDFAQTYSYWGDGSQGKLISTKGRFSDNDSYALFNQSFRDYDGNTYFTGSALIKKPKWGAIVSSAVLAPLLFPSVFILGASGTTKCKLTDVVLVKQNPKGVLNLDKAVTVQNTGYYRGIVPLVLYNNRSFYRVLNSDTKTNYLVIDDSKDILIYNVNKKTVQRTIPHKDGLIKTNVYPAKEGHVLISEYNKKEKYTRFSIEAL